MGTAKTDEGYGKPFIYDAFDGMQDLNNLIVDDFWQWPDKPEGPVFLSPTSESGGEPAFWVKIATAINDNDQISVTGTYRIAPDIPIDPIPEPSTMLLLSTGLVGLIGFGRKKLFKK